MYRVLGVRRAATSRLCNKDIIKVWLSMIAHTLCAVDHLGCMKRYSCNCDFSEGVRVACPLRGRADSSTGTAVSPWNMRYTNTSHDTRIADEVEHLAQEPHRERVFRHDSHPDWCMRSCGMHRRAKHAGVTGLSVD